MSNNDVDWGKGMSSMYDQVKNDEKTLKDENSIEPRVPVAFLFEEGRYFFRIWYDILSDGNLRPYRYLNAHMLKINWKGEVKDFGRWVMDSRIQTLVTNHKSSLEQHIGTAYYKLQAKPYLMFMARIINCPSSKYITKDKDHVLILTSNGLKSFIRFISSLAKEDFARIFTPTRESEAISLSVSRTNEGKPPIYVFSLSKEISPAIGETPIMPDGVSYTGLDEVWASKNAKISDESFFAFKKLIMEIVNVDHRSYYDPGSNIKSSSGVTREELETPPEPLSSGDNPDSEDIPYPASPVPETSSVSGEEDSVELKKLKDQVGTRGCVLANRAQEEPSILKDFDSPQYGHRPLTNPADCLVRCPPEIRGDCLSLTSEIARMTIHGK